MLKFLLSIVKHTLKNSKGEEEASPPHLPRYLPPLLLSLHSQFSRFPSGAILLPSEKLLLAILSEQAYWLQICLVFLHLRMSLFHLHSYMILSLDVKLCVDSSLLAPYKCCAASFRALWFLMRNPRSLESVFPCG